MIKDIKELNFPEYATLNQATVTLQDMAEKTIASQVKIDGQITPDFSYDWAVEFKGDKYIMPLRQPQGAKENTSLCSTIDLTFQHWAIYQLKRWYFFTLADVNAGTAVPDKYIASVSLNLKNFCDLFGKILNYYYDDKITLDFNDPAKHPETGWQYNQEPTAVEISHSYIWDVLIKLYDLYAVRWVIEPNGDRDHYVIRIGYPTTEISHIFEYGFEGGLLKVERQVQDENIRNMIIGRGGNKNLPYRYFKKHDEQNASFSPDPDWVPELANIPFAELHGATFRSYIQGWKAAHTDEYRKYASDKEAYKKKYGHDYPDNEEWTVTTPSADKAYTPWAWMRGNTDEKFNPVEFVADGFETSENGYGIVRDSSIAKYGELMGGLDNNEDIYPTIHGIEIDGLGRIDEVVAVEEILSDDIENNETNSYEETKAPECKGIVTNIAPASYKTLTLKSNGTFTVEKGRYANLIDATAKVLSVKGNGVLLNAQISAEAPADKQILKVYNAKTGAEHSASAIPEGTWRYESVVSVHNLLLDKTIDIEIGILSAKIQDATIDGRPNNTWEIWVKNLWDSDKQSNETYAQYAERVWRPILGDREGNEAKVMFSTGALAVSEDYEFTIVRTPIYDASKSLNGVPSHWRITLAKSDADLEPLGVYVPSVMRQAVAGDHIVFIGIDMPHMYVVKAEERLDDWKKDELVKVKDIKPTWVVGLDKVRIHNYGRPGALVEQLRIGNSLYIADKRFILTEKGSEAAYETLYLQSITYNYLEPTQNECNLLPDIEIVLSDKYEVSVNPVATLQGEVDAIRHQISGSLSNIEQLVRKTGDTRYIRKDRADRAAGVIDFLKGLISRENASFRNGSTFGDFISGALGGHIDSRGNMEMESGIFRSFLQIYELIVNRQQTIEGDVLLTEGDSIEEVIPLGLSEEGNPRYILRLHPEWEGYRTAQYEGNVIRGIYNDITERTGQDAGTTQFNNATYYTSWMRVLEVRPEINEIDVVLYPDDDVPAGHNFPPQPMMKFARWGNAGETEEQKRRQTLLFLSSTEGRIMKYSHVTKPIIDLGNIAVSLGTVPEFIPDSDSRVKPGDEVLYAKTVITQNFLTYDYQGRPEPTIVWRGQYDPASIYYDGTNLREDTQKYEKSNVLYYGCQWLCNKTGTKNPPSWDSTDWSLYQGDPRLVLTLNADADAVDADNPVIVLQALLSIYYQDITSDPKIRWDWTRQTIRNGTEDSASDNIWNAAHENCGLSILSLTKEDMNYAFGHHPDNCIFTVTASLIGNQGNIEHTRTQAINLC